MVRSNIHVICLALLSALILTECSGNAIESKIESKAVQNSTYLLAANPGNQWKRLIKQKLYTARSAKNERKFRFGKRGNGE